MVKLAVDAAVGIVDFVLCPYGGLMQVSWALECGAAWLHELVLAL